MLPKNRRLPRHSFLIAQKQGKSYRFPHLSIVYHPVSPINSQQSRFAIITSAKLHKHATARNRLRRHIYNLLQTGNFKPIIPADIIIIPRPSMLKLNHDQINLALNQVLSKISLL